LAICGPEDKALILTALDTLLRLSSVIRLEWPQVKFPQRSILPLNAKVSTDAKPMSTRLYDALSAIRRPGGYVFESLHGGLGETAAKNRAIRRFAELCDAAEITRGRARDGLTFHCLRHTGATRALQRGASLRTVMKLGGWKNAQTVLRYLHVADADVIAAAESIGNHVT
jgi:integrase